MARVSKAVAAETPLLFEELAPEPVAEKAPKPKKEKKVSKQTEFDPTNLPAAPPDRPEVVAEKNRKAWWRK